MSLVKYINVENALDKNYTNILLNTSVNVIMYQLLDKTTDFTELIKRGHCYIIHIIGVVDL